MSVRNSLARYWNRLENVGYRLSCLARGLLKRLKYALRRGLKLVVLFIQMIQYRLDVLHIDPIDELSDQPFLRI